MGASINLCITKKSKLHYDKEGENQKGALFFIPKHKKKKTAQIGQKLLVQLDISLGLKCWGKIKNPIVQFMVRLF